MARALVLAAIAAGGAGVLAACGGGDGAAPVGNGSPVAPTESEPANGRSGPVDEVDLVTARARVLEFLDALAAGEIDEAASLVGPVSEERAGAAGGLRSMLRASTEGHGAWASATDRSVQAVGIDAGLVAVVLSGTLEVEGAREHRVEVFPVRRAESARAWFVEPWAYSLAEGKPLAIARPQMDAEEIARVDRLTVEVRVEDGGRLYLSVDGQPPEEDRLAAGQTATFSRSIDGEALAIAVLDSGPTLAALGFLAVR